MRRPIKRSLRGFTLMEVIIVIGVLGFMLGGIWMITATVREQQQIQSTFGHMMMIVQNVKSLYAKTHKINTPSNFNTANMVKAGIFPEEILDATSIPPVPKTVWDTDIELSAPTTTSFTLLYEATIPNVACRTLIGRAVGTERDPGLISISANGSAFTGSALDTLSAANPSLNNCSQIRLTFGFK